MHGVKPAAIAAAGWIVFLPLSACSSDATGPISFGRFGPSSGDSGRGSFRFDVATAATQIEDMDTATDWYLWTRPKDAGGLGHATFCPRTPAPWQRPEVVARARPDPYPRTRCGSSSSAAPG
jgi:hypothetical protein